MKTLAELASIYGVDKALPFLNYPPLYDLLFAPIQDKPIRLLEIGVQRGRSLRMWYDYFPSATIFGYDILRWSRLSRYNRDRIFNFSGDQSKREDLNKFIHMFGGEFDIIIDDGSHYSDHQFISLASLYYYLKPGGMYFVEDLQAEPAQPFRKAMRKWRCGEDWTAKVLFPHEIENLKKNTKFVKFVDEGEKLALIQKNSMELNK